MNVAFFGSSLVSAYWNGAATYYRGLIRALSSRGFHVTFFEPDAFERQQHRDIDDPAWAAVVVYDASAEGLDGALARAAHADVVVKASGVGVFDRELEARVLDGPAGQLRVFWDVDAAATLERMQAVEDDPFRALVPKYDLILTYGGGEPVRAAYLAAGARACVPVYNALDPDTHFPVPPDPRFDGALGFLGNRLPDREARVDEFFFGAARARPALQFVIGGNGWTDKARPSNVRTVGHVYTREHNAFNSTPTAVLNVNRDSMARFGYSPATRVFEAAGAGACLITDRFDGVELFLEPGSEVLVAESGAEVAEILARLTPATARMTGARARRRILAEHTYDRRAAQVAALLRGKAVAA